MNLKKASAPEYLRRLFDKYKYVLLLCAVGLILILLPFGGKTESAAEAEESASEEDPVLLLQSQLEALFSEVSGVGRVRVMLTAQSGGETVYAYDESKSASKSDGGASSSSSMTLVTVGGSEGDPVVVRVDAPLFSGAVVVCEGAESAKVRLALTEALRSLTGITADNIVIVKMK